MVVGLKFIRGVVKSIIVFRCGQSLKHPKRVPTVPWERCSIFDTPSLLYSIQNNLVNVNSLDPVGDLSEWQAPKRKMLCKRDVYPLPQEGACRASRDLCYSSSFHTHLFCITSSLVPKAPIPPIFCVKSFTFSRIPRIRDSARSSSHEVLM
jgi:hypothetical protein